MQIELISILEGFGFRASRKFVINSEIVTYSFHGLPVGVETFGTVSRATITIIAHIRRRITLLIAAHEPTSRAYMIYWVRIRVRRKGFNVVALIPTGFMNSYKRLATEP